MRFQQIGLFFLNSTFNLFFFVVGLNWQEILKKNKHYYQQEDNKHNNTQLVIKPSIILHLYFNDKQHEDETC